MMCFKKCRKGPEDGVTLIEITIALALIGLVIAMIFSFTDMGTRMFNRSKIQMQNQADVRTPIDFISQELRIADNVTLLSAVPGTHAGNEFYLENGRILYYKNTSPTAIPGASTVDDYTFSATKIDQDRVRITVGKVGTTQYDVSTEIQVLNISPAGITGTAGVPAIGLRFTQTAAMVSGGLTVTGATSPPNATVPQYSVYVMPSTAVVQYSDGTTGQLPVTWSGSVDTSIIGSLTISGTVASYPVQLQVTVTPVSIVSIDSITDTVVMEEPYTMPNPITATVASTPPTTQPVSVVWNPAAIDTSTAGIKTSEGTVAGYAPKVVLSVTVTNQLAAPVAVKAGNTVTVTGKPGATAVLMKNNGDVISEQVLDAAGKYTFSGAGSAARVYLKKTGWTNSITVSF